MIKSRFSKAIIPLAFTTAVSGGMLVKSAVKPTEPQAVKTEVPAKTNPIENPAVLGTIFTLGLLGTAGAAALGKSVDLRYKNSHEQIEDIYDIATLEEKDYTEAFEEECAELDKQGINYDRDELRKQKYTPLNKEAVLEQIDAYKANLRRVTENIRYDKKSEQQLKYLIEEVKSGVKYDKEIDEEIKFRMQFQFDKATTPQKKWKAKEATYKSEHPEVNFDKLNGIPLQSKIMHQIQEAVAKVAAGKLVYSEEEAIKNLNQIKKQITEQPEILNKYDREECLRLIEKSLNEFDSETYQQIVEILVYHQQTY